MGQWARSKATPNMTLSRPNFRPIINGKRTVSTGRIVAAGVGDYDYAVVLKKNMAIDYGDMFDYEITGVSGNYKIIERDKEPSNSQYVS